MNQMITLAVAEKLEVMEVMDNLKWRASRADYAWFDPFMKREGGHKIESTTHSPTHAETLSHNFHPKAAVGTSSAV